MEGLLNLKYELEKQYRKAQEALFIEK